MRSLVLFLFVFLAACATPQVALVKTPPAAPAPVVDASEDDVAIPIGKDDAVRGERRAPVTLVIFSDFQCPYCAKLATTVEGLHQAYGDDKIRIVFKHNPLSGHEHARLAAEVATGVRDLNGDGAFWRFHNRAFKKQNDISPEAIRGWATDAGVDARALEAGLASKRWAPKVDADILLARRLKTNGTPATFINGRLLVGAQRFEKFSAAIDLELASTSALLAQGTPPDRLYARAVAANLRADDEEDEADEAAEAAKMAVEAKIVHKVPTRSAPIRGPKAALVTIIEFSDYQCPYCKRTEDTLTRIRTEYGDKVRLVWRDLPLGFHPRAEPAAELARAAQALKGDAAFWQVHDLLFASQPALEDSDLERIAAEAKLDVPKAMAAVRAHAYQRVIDEDTFDGDDFEAAGTPHFFINGHRLVGAQPFDKFKGVIEEELTKAEALVKSGTPLAKIYDAEIKDGIAAPEPAKRALAAAPPNQPFRGTANGKVLIQEVADFQCPYCKQADATMEELLKAYPGKIKLVWRDKPLEMHPDAPLAAEAAREAFAQKGNDGFDQMHKLLFQNQRALKKEDLDGYARTLGLDMPRFDRALEQHTHRAAVEADDRATTEAKINSTPSFFVGPYFISGAMPLASFRRLVELVLAEAPQSRLP